MAKKRVKRVKKDSGESKREVQLKMTVLFMIVLIITLAVFYMISTSSKKFGYAGIKFQPEKLGSKLFYTGNFPLLDSLGNVNSYLTVYFREDPRKLGNISVDGNIIFKKKIAVAADSNFVYKCSDSLIAATTLSQYLSKLGKTTFPATTNKTEALAMNRTYVACNNTSNYSVVEFIEGDETKIVGNADCYKFYVKNCDVMNITERFMVAAYAQSKGIKI